MHTLWWLSTLLGRQNNHNKQIDYFFIQRESNGIEYITFAEGITKTWQCRSHEKYCLALPKIFVSNVELSNFIFQNDLWNYRTTEHFVYQL